MQQAASVAEIDPELWRLAGGGASTFLGLPFLAALEAAPPEGVAFHYAVLGHGNRPVAVVACQRIRVSSRQLEADHTAVPNFLRRVAAGFRNRALGLFGRELLVCGNLVTSGTHGVAFAPGIAPAEGWPLVVAYLKQLQRASGAHYLLVKDLFDSDTAACDTLQSLGLNRLTTEPAMVLDFDPAWTGIADYLADLKAKYRKAVKRVVDGVDGQGLVFREERLEALNPPRLHDLYRQVEAHAEVRFGLLPPDHLHALAQLGQERFRCRVLYRNDVPVGFSTLLRDGENAHAHVVGFDYRSNEEVPVYHRLLLGLLEEALAWGCKRICYGRTALEPKARLGAKPRATSVFIRHRNPVLHRLAGGLVRLLPRATAPERHPFAERGRDARLVVED